MPLSDVYEDNEPGLVCCAHVVDIDNDNGIDVPDFVIDSNINAEANNEVIMLRLLRYMYRPPHSASAADYITALMIFASIKIAPLNNFPSEFPK
jgi:hypothetical protein